MHHVLALELPNMAENTEKSYFVTDVLCNH